MQVHVNMHAKEIQECCCFHYLIWDLKEEEDAKKFEYVLDFEIHCQKYKELQRATINMVFNTMKK